MAVSYTTTYNLTKPEVGASEDQWGDLLNTNFDSIDDILDGTTSITGLTLSGNITFGDNDKAIFGAGSDLQIYHDGSHSYISDQGTGALRIGGDADVGFLNAAFNEWKVQATSDGSVKLFDNGSQKLATTSTGIDVTGTVTADGLTVDATESYINGRLRLESGANSQDLRFSDTSTTDQNAQLRLSSGSLLVQSQNNAFNGATTRASFASNGDISFYEDTGTTAKFFWDASAESLGLNKTSSLGTAKLEIKGAGNTNATNSIFVEDSGAAGVFAVRDNGEVFIKDSLGIGTSSPDTKMHIDQTSQGNFTEAMRISNTGGGANEGNYIQFEVSNTSGYGSRIGGRREGTGGVGLHFYTGAINSAPTERMRIDSSGRVGIGTSSPSSRLHVEQAADANGMRLSYATRGSGHVKFHLTGVTNDGYALTHHNGTNENTLSYATRTLHSWNTNNTERMRIDSSGNLLVGKSSSSFSTVGSEFGSALNSEGWVSFLTSNNTSANVGGTIALNRKSTDGAIARFFKDGATVGSIGTWSGTTFIGTGDTGIAFAAGGDDIRPFNPSSVAQRDAAINLGESGNRFKDLYLSGGVYLGGTGAANKLDDYETGTFTPVIDPTGAAGSGTYTTQQGSYVKVGDLVHINIRLGWSAHTGTGGMRITGLPFTSSNAYCGLSVSYRDGLTISSGHTCNVAVIPSNTTAYVYEISTGTDNASLVTMDSVVADISISGTYTVA